MERRASLLYRAHLRQEKERMASLGSCYRWDIRGGVNSDVSRRAQAAADCLADAEAGEPACWFTIALMLGMFSSAGVTLR